MTNEEKLQQVPRPIRDWFWSDDADEAIATIKEHFSLPDDDPALPRLIFHVEVRDIPLEQLEEKIASELGVSASTARAIYEEVKVALFVPIARDLVQFGIGLKELAGAARATLPPTPVGPALDPNAAAVVPAPTSFFLAPAAGPTPAPPSSTVVPTPSGAPVSLHTDALFAQQNVKPPVSINIGAPGVGVSSFSKPAPLTASAPRTAQVNIGNFSASTGKKVESLFVERKTPQLQQINYAAPAPEAPPAESGGPVPLATITPLPGGAEYIEQPEPVPQAPQPENTPEEKEGFFSSLLSKIAPRSAARKKLTQLQAAAEAEIAATAQAVDYTEASPAEGARETAPLPIGDLPAPPKA